MKAVPLDALFSPICALCHLIFCLFSYLQVEATVNQPGFGFTKGLKSTEFSFQLMENLIIIPVRVNHTMTLKFILDSGSKTPMILNPVLGKKLELTYGKNIAFSGRGYQGKVNGKMAHDIVLEIPGVIATGMSMVVLSKDYLKSKEFPEQVHGILGYGLFCRFIVDIDYENLVIRLYEPEVYKPGILFKSFDIELRDTKPYVEAALTTSVAQNAKVNLLLDTGAGTGLLLDTHSNSGIIIPSKKNNRFVGRGLGGNIMGKKGEIYRMKIGDFTLRDFKATITGKVYHNTRKPHQKRHGSIGGGIFIQFKQVVFNYAGRKVYIRKNISLTMTDE